MTYLSELRNAIRKLHGCDAEHEATVDVKEEFQGTILWEGKVEIFRLINHATARQAYAWAFVDKTGLTQYVAILNSPPVDSPQKAVKAMIAARFRAEQKKQKNS
jgi:hypothetical protein